MRLGGSGGYYELMFRRKFDAPIKLRHIWIPLVFLLVTLYRNQNIAKLEIIELVCALGITVMCFLPLFIWASKDYREPPAFQCYCAIHFPYYAYPILSSDLGYMNAPESGRAVACVSIFLYLIILNIVYHMGRRGYSAKDVASHFRYRYMPTRRVLPLFTTGIMAWSLYTILDRFGYVKLGAVQNIAYLFFLCGGMVSIWTMMRLLGEGKLSVGNGLFVLFWFGLGLAVSIGAGTLIEGLTLVIVATASYALGRSRVPWFTIILALGLFAFLNLGKSEMRRVFWHPYSPTLSWFGDDQRASVIDVYSIWIPASFEILARGEVIGGEDRSLMKRASLMEYYTDIVTNTPDPVGYLYGKTYMYTPFIVVPRFLWPDKPEFHSATTELGVRYNITTERRAKVTTIAIGSLAEAWANFGWMGIVLLAVGVGLIMRAVAVYCFACHPHSLRGFMSVLWIAFGFQIEPVVSVWICSFGQAAVITVLALYPLTRRYTRSGELAEAVFRPGAVGA